MKEPTSLRIRPFQIWRLGTFLPWYCLGVIRLWSYHTSNSSLTGIWLLCSDWHANICKVLDHAVFFRWGNYRVFFSEITVCLIWRRCLKWKNMNRSWLVLGNKQAHSGDNTNVGVIQRSWRARLEIIIDLPIGFPINNIISLTCKTAHKRQD